MPIGEFYTRPSRSAIFARYKKSFITKGCTPRKAEDLAWRKLLRKRL